MTITLVIPEEPWYVWVLVWIGVVLLWTWGSCLGRDLYDAIFRKKAN